MTHQTFKLILAIIVLIPMLASIAELKGWIRNDTAVPVLYILSLGALLIALAFV